MLKFFLVPVAVVLVALAAFSGAPSVQAQACGTYCAFPGMLVTSTATATGATCAIAEANLRTQLQSYANSYCGTPACQLVVTITSACQASGSGYTVSGYANHGCRDTTC